MNSDFLRKENESAYNHIKRIVYGKLVDKTITEDFEELSEVIFGEGNSYNSSEVRKRMYGIKRVIDLLEDERIENISDDKILKELEIKRTEIEKEKFRFFDQRTAYNKTVRDDARWDELKNIITNSIKTIKPYSNEFKFNTIQSDNDLLVGLNDIHFGIEINNYWNKYNSDIAKQRLEKYLQVIISVQQLHKSENCYVCANGDLISGNIHYTIALANRENVVEQVMGVSELISWFLSELSNHFKNVYFSVVAGNHSRLNIKDMSPKNERLDDLIPFYIKARLQNLNNVFIIEDKIDNTMSMIKIRGLNYVGVHGDVDTVNGILKLVEMLPHKVYGILFGHLHHNSTNFIQGYKVMMSGSLMGTDDFCIEKRIFGKPQQLVAVCDKNGVKCTYDVIFE
jgi:hypothetical protein